MGGSTSKAARAATTLRSTKVEGHPKLYTETPHPLGATAGQPSESKPEAVLEGSKDPGLEQMLQRLGQVRVPRPTTHYRPEENMLDILRRRVQAEEAAEAASSARMANRPTVALLCNYLDELKLVTSPDQASKLAEAFELDPKAASVLARHVNSTSTKTVKDPDPSKPPHQMAIWVSSHCVA